jgi:diguanylate cyclase (GGDEF)-like protein/PAS domain S-box-containing protein
MWQSLLANLAVVAMVLIGWNALSEAVGRRGRLTRSVIFGMAMAAGTLGSMSMGFEVTPGVFFDLRNTVLVVSGLFGGVPAAILTAACALAYRIWLGGAVGFGVVGILLSTAIGLVVRRFRRARINSLGDVVMAAGLSVLSTTVVFLMVAIDWRVAVGDIATLALISGPSTLALGSVLVWEDQRRRLAETGRQLRSMVDALPDCLNIKDVDGRFLAANPATAKLMNVPDADALIGRTDFDFYPGDTAQAFRTDELAAMKSGVAVTIEQFARHADGRATWLSTLKAPAFDATGAMIGLVTSNRDITERKELQDKLDETRAYLDQALKTMSDGLAIYDRAGVLQFANDRYRAMFPASASFRVPGNRLEDILAASILAGDEMVPENVTPAAHVEAAMAALFTDGEYLIRRSDGRIYNCRNAVMETGGVLVVISDQTERLNNQKMLEQQALHDPLTGLPNRAYFNQEIQRRLDKARAEGEELAVMLLDLDRFKQVNDSHGHAAGDELLIEVGRRLGASTRHGDFISRLGGDEFAILLSGQQQVAGGASMAARIMKAFAKPMTIGDVALRPGGTIGYSVWPHDPSDCEGLLRNADVALYEAKTRGRGTWRYHQPPAPQNGDRRRAGGA